MTWKLEIGEIKETPSLDGGNSNIFSFSHLVGEDSYF